MRSVGFIVMAVTAAVLAGCMQTGGPGIFAHDAAPPWQQNFGGASLPEFLRPGASRVAAAPVAVAPAPVVAAPIAPAPLVAGPVPIAAAPMAIEPGLVAQPIAMQDGLVYTLDSGDKLRVVVFGQEGLSASYSVDTSGRITIPLIGAVPARGLTTAALQQAIAAKLRNGFVREPHVAVEVEIYRPFFILGEVTLPGQYPYVPNMTVETAVAIAGGFTPRAFKHRIEISHQVGGLTEKRVVSPNYPVQPGDTVHIAERWF
ncbi:MAG: polysaccharide export protein [Alphaproteobacteria bacterium]|nr:polysaccharide export protein [Alphaproteobacteria bacterium]